MPISKTQPMRPAEIAVIDAVNNLHVDITDEITTTVRSYTDPKFAVVNNNVSALDTRVTTLDSTTSTLETTLNEYQAQFEAALSNITRSLNYLEGLITTLQTNVNSSVAALQDADTAITGRLDTIEGLIPSMQGDISTNSGNIATLDSTVSTMQTTLNSYSAGYAALPIGDTNYTFAGSSAFIVIRRGTTNNGVMLLSNSDANSYNIGDIQNVTLTKAENSRTFTITNPGSIKGVVFSNNITQITN